MHDVIEEGFWLPINLDQLLNLLEGISAVCIDFNNVIVWNGHNMTKVVLDLRIVEEAVLRGDDQLGA